MRIAICFSGAIRSFKSCYPSIYRSLIEPLNADVFMHIWTFGEDISQHKNEHRYITHFKLQNDECSMDYVLGKVKPKKYVVDEYNYEWEKEIVSGCNGYKVIRYMSDHDTNYAVSSMGMYFKIFKANELKCQYEEENNFKYDIVIRCRLDFKWFDILSVDSLKGLKENELLIVKDSYCTTAKWEGNDKFFAAKSETMDKMCNLYNEIEYYHKNKICQIEGQNLNKFHIKKLKLNLVYFGSKDTYYKCTHKGRVHTRKVYCLVYNPYSFIGYHICDKLMDRGYYVHGYGDTNTKVKEMNKKSLETFYSFDDVKSVDELKNYKCVIISDYSDYIGKISHDNITYIIDSNLNNLDESVKIYNNSKSCHKMFMLYNTYGPRSDINNDFYKMYDGKEKYTIDGRLCFIQDCINYMINIILKNKNFKRTLIGDHILDNSLKFLKTHVVNIPIREDQIDKISNINNYSIINTIRWFNSIN